MNTEAARSLSRELTRVAKFLDVVAESGLLADTAPQQPPAPPPPSALPAAKQTKPPPSPARSPRPVTVAKPTPSRATSSDRLRAYYRKHPQASGAQACRDVGCSSTLALSVRRELVKAGEISKAAVPSSPPTGQKEKDDGDEEEEPAGGEASCLAIALPGSRVANVPPCQPVNEQAGPHAKVHERKPRRNLTRAERTARTRQRYAVLADKIRALPFAELSVSEIAERLLVSENHVKRCCSAFDILCRGKRPYKPIENPLFSMPADEVERLYPELHKEFQRMIYEERAPQVRAKWRPVIARKRNNYFRDPFALEPLDVHAAGIDLHIKDRME